MQSRSTLVLLGLVSLFLGGVGGGVLGSAMMGRPTTQPSPVAAPGTAPSGTDPQLVGAIGELVDEVRRLRNAPAAVGAAERRPAEQPDTPALDPEALLASIERLTQALQAAQGRVSPGGIGITPLFVPAGGKRAEEVAALVGRDWEELSREHRFWTFQQVLDRYGTPDEVGDDGRWRYFHDDGETLHVFTFVFAAGFLTNLYD